MRPIGSSQPITDNDVKNGQIRFPQDTKRHLPATKMRVRVVLRDLPLDGVLYAPNDREKSRSGTLRIGVDAARRQIEPGERLTVELAEDGAIHLK